MIGIDIEALKNEIKNKRYQWSSGPTPLSELSEDEIKKLFKVPIKKEEIERMTSEIRKAEASEVEMGITYEYPKKWDWRNIKNGDKYENWTTPIKEQKKCGACVAFGVVAAVESNLKIFRKNPKKDPNLSEADIFFCACSKCCETGMEPKVALDYVMYSGVADDGCYKYNPKDQNCNPCKNRKKRVVKIQNWRTISTVDNAKDWIYNHGPVLCLMEVYSDFLTYTGGIYRHVNGDKVGDHYICIVGYDNINECWICKNSVGGTKWGEKGWFRISYGECGIGESRSFNTTEFPSIDDSIIMPKDGNVKVTFKSKDAKYTNEFSIYEPVKKSIFKAKDSEVGNSFNIGPFKSGQTLVFALKSPEGTFYTNPSLNPDACVHVKKKQINNDTFEFGWEDQYGLGDWDFNDLIVDIQIPIV